jgi:hypothetical protein
MCPFVYDAFGNVRKEMLPLLAVAQNKLDRLYLSGFFSPLGNAPTLINKYPKKLDWITLLRIFPHHR